MNPKTQRAQSRPAALAQLMTVATTLGPDELRVLASLARRLYVGDKRYGRLDLRVDRRDFRREAGEEVEDFLIYTACRWLTKGARRSARRTA